MGNCPEGNWKVGKVPEIARDIAGYRRIKVDLGILSPEMNAKMPLKALEGRGRVTEARRVRAL
jgi:hypothetical protein